jgi:hypothetical protein
MGTAPSSGIREELQEATASLPEPRPSSRSELMLLPGSWSPARYPAVHATHMKCSTSGF